MVDIVRATDGGGTLVLELGHHELLIRQRYEVLGIINDILIAFWFTVGSILFFWPATTHAGTWLFVGTSVQLGVRPAIRLSRRVHLGRVRDGHVVDSVHDS